MDTYLHQQDHSAPKIADLSDAFRRTLEGGRVCLTRGVAALPAAEAAVVVAAVRTFAAFTPDNDPYGEHDFGAFAVDGTRFCFKIDYYDPSLRFGSYDPSDPDKTVRVLTILFADEY